jgi:hypothetical protein
MADKRVGQRDNDFQALASQGRASFVSELRRFAMQNRKWWLVPLIVVLLGIGLIIVLGGTAAAPFIYTLF